MNTLVHMMPAVFGRKGKTVHDLLTAVIEKTKGVGARVPDSIESLKAALSTLLPTMCGSSNENPSALSPSRLSAATVIAAALANNDMVSSSGASLCMCGSICFC